MKMPLWLKMLLLFLPLSLVFSVLGTVSEFLIAPIFFFALMLFPGADAENPRLVRFMPWLWALEAVVALGLLALKMVGKSPFGPEMRAPTPLEMWSTILFAPPMIWTLVRRNGFFRPLLVFQAVAALAISFWVYSGRTGDIKAVFELCGDIVAELMVTIYLLARAKIARATPQTTALAPGE